MKHAQVLQILQTHWAEIRAHDVKSLALFGSIARDEGRLDSDVDLLVEFAHPVGLFAFINLQPYLEQLLGCKVDLGTPKSLRPRLRERVLQEALYVTSGLA